MEAHDRRLRLLDPYFLGALALLLLNDHVWKTTYGGFWTGKLSDFAGLYAFAWALMALSRQAPRRVAAAVALVWMAWKSPLSQPLLDAWNGLGIYALGRVVDYGDWAALVVLPLAARRARAEIRPLLRLRDWQPLAHAAIGGVTLVAFVATSYSESHDYKNEYPLGMTREEAVARLNAIEAENQAGNPTLSLTHAFANKYENDQDIRLYLHHSQEKEEKTDTIFARIDDSVFVDEIRHYGVNEVDTMYVNPDGYFRLLVRVAAESDTSVACKVVPAILRLLSDGPHSKLSLVRMDAYNCPLKIPEDSKDDNADFLRKTFEETVVNKLK